MKEIKKNLLLNVNCPFVLVESKTDTLNDYNIKVLNLTKSKAKEDGFCEAFAVTTSEKENMKEPLNFLVDKIIEMNEGNNIDSKGREGKEGKACSCCSIL